MTKENVSEIKIIYNINKKDEKHEEYEEDINIFGDVFVRNNKSKTKCKMIIDNKFYELTEKFNIENYNNNKLEIILKGIDKIINMSFMFAECSSLSSLPNISEWNTNDVTDMSCMFAQCSSLLSLPDISKLNTNNVTDMS